MQWRCDEPCGVRGERYLRAEPSALVAIALRCRHGRGVPALQELRLCKIDVRYRADAVTVNHLDTIQAHLSESPKATGAAFDTSVKKVLLEARASVQKISEAVAEKRAAISVKKK